MTDSLSRSGKGALTADLSAGGFKVTNLAAATNANDAVRLVQVTAGYQPLDADLTAIAALTATTDNFLQSKSSAWASRTPTQVTADLIAFAGDSGSGGSKGLVPAPASGDTAAGKRLAPDGTWTGPATQADQETATSIITHVTPGRQQFHPSAAKAWAFVTVSAGSPTLQTSHNITSITDTAAGALTVTIAADFSTANWASIATCENNDSTFDDNSDLQIVWVRNGSKAAGSVVLDTSSGSSAVLVDPASWSFVGFGDQV